MKKIVLTTMTVFMFVCSTHAQFQKGNRVLGFGFNISSQSSNNYDAASNSVQHAFVSVMLAKAKSENSLKGFYVNSGYEKSKLENASSQFYQSENYSAGAGYLVRKYKSIGKNFFVFGEGSGGFNYSNRYHNNDNRDKSYNKNYGAGINFYPGLAYKWSDKFLLELRFADFAYIGFNYFENRMNNTTTRVERSFSMGTNLGLGYLSNLGIGARWILK